jgi:transposase
MKAMEVIHPRCAGIDVHKETAVVCIRQSRPGDEADEQVRTFATTSAGLLELGDWLVENQVSIAAMESTGVYWKPVWNLLEDRVKLILANSRDTKQVPGRKTDAKDGRWIAQLLSCGLLKPSFVPPRPQRDLRDLTRGRTSLMQDKARVANRLQKILEDANIKLSDVASDVLGVSGREMIRALIEGKMTPQQIAELARLRLRQKIPALSQALTGKVTGHHRFMLKMLLEQIEQAEARIARLDERIAEVMSPLEQTARDLLDEIPGINGRAAESILAEIGFDMSRFPTADHLASWAGMCCGNNQSGGKRRSGRMPDGNGWLKGVLNQCAWAASRTKDSYFAAQFRRVAARRGVKRAVMAVAHSQLCICWHLLKNGEQYKDLGADYFDRTDEDRTRRNLVRRLEKLGYEVRVEKKPAA